MAEVVLFHHGQGLTEGCKAFAEELRTAGHVVHLPDLYEGRVFATLPEGMEHVRGIGFGEILERGRHAVEGLPEEIVYAGLSLGVLPAQMLAQTRPGAQGAVLMHAAVPLEEFGGTWPQGVPLQIHTMQDDELGDVDVARAIGAQVPEAEVFLHPGDRHLFTDRSLADYDEPVAKRVTELVLEFLR